MNYPAIAGHLRSRGRAVPIEAIEEAEMRARVKLDADLACGTSTEGRPAQDLYLGYLLEGLGLTDAGEVEAAASFRRDYNAPGGLFDSGLVGVEKPDPRIFELGLREAGVVARDAVYVGDLYSVDVLGSRAAGIRPILLDPRGYWGPRDCAVARDLHEALSLVLDPRRNPID